MEEIIFLNIDELAPNPLRPRSSFPYESLVKLSDSIRKHGIINPILVASTPAGYVVISGERRWRAAKLAGLTEIPAIVKKSSSEEALILSLVENIQREPLTIFEQGSTIQRLRSDFKLSLQEIGEKVGLSLNELEQRLKLLGLSDKVKNEILERKMDDRETLELAEKEDEKEIYREVIKKGRHSF
ncbi:hypothetical protein B5M47_01775 [candidate division CPR3 bacterium 4484_211]|uniref:ParB-like N-terminal domain-containing protein n=1 Tax=candidate division CPR3 bacterium 4484_211 TaxID=1968527 RepID=A0A1W9NYG0_UNCC3|nr:MAG: hypothetical protein B5M47_01775 [candidate division CPR3 bacterium 4484_211]